MDSAVARHSGNVYNRPSYGAVGNAVCRLWESSFYFSTACEWRFPWRNGWLCTFPLCNYLSMANIFPSIFFNLVFFIHILNGQLSVMDNCPIN